MSSLVHLGSSSPMSMTKEELSLALTGPTFAMPPKTTTRVPSSSATTKEWPILAGGLNPPLVSILRHLRAEAAALGLGGAAWATWVWGAACLT